MPKNDEDRVVVIDVDGKPKKISKREVAKENEKLEQAIKEKKTKLKTRKKQKTEESKMPVMLVEQQDRSINIGVVGVGQCGSKLAEEFYNRGYNTVVINTALQDLKPIKIPEGQKLFLDYSLGGAAKDLDTGQAAVETYSGAVVKHLKDNFEDCEILLLATSGGGGTGSGSAEVMVELMAGLDKPISVLYVLPLGSEDTLAKHNAIQTLAKLAKLAKSDVINSLIVIDNAKIELMFPG
ncbi:hypothetical protein LCGC14_3141510, partial [marine sediment metagenome]